jgi:hypothetical protein
MSLRYEIPRSSRYILTSNVFTATFNNPLLGGYDWGVAGNVGQKIIDMEPGSIYLIERISIGADMGEAEFLEAILTLPLITLRESQSNELVYKAPFPVTNFIDDKDIVGWAYTDKGDEDLISTFTGQLTQTAALVGRATLSFFINYSIYAIDDSVFTNKFKGILGGQQGEQVSGFRG